MTDAYTTGDYIWQDVEKTANGVQTLYLRNALGQLASALTGGVYTDYVNSAEGDRIAEVIGAGGSSPAYYFHTDPLGTVRAITDENGNNILNCGQEPSYPNGSMLTYDPFGGEISGCTQSTTNFKFTGQERDPESGWDYFGARTYASNLARFLSPDPERAGADPKDPQSWNGYSYVRNHPLTAVDPSGALLASNSPWIDDNCTVDGFGQNCGDIGWNALAQCPNNDCGPIYTSNGGGQWAIINADADGNIAYQPIGPTLDQWLLQQSFKEFRWVSP